MHYFKMVIFCKKLQLKKLNLVTLKILFFGVFGYTLFQTGHILQKVTTKKTKFGHTKNLGFGFWRF